jgi:DNA-binding MarR family transcriptional regulator
MGQTRQAVQRLVNEMIEDGLIEPLDNPKHKRAKLLSLTDKGQDTFSKVMEKQVPWVNSIAKDIQEEDLNSVITTLKYLNAYLDT